MTVACAEGVESYYIVAYIPPTIWVATYIVAYIGDYYIVPDI